MQQQTQLEAPESETEFLPSTSFSASNNQEENLHSSAKMQERRTTDTKQASTLAEIIKFRKQAQSRYRTNWMYSLLLMPLFLISEVFLPIQSRSLFLPLLIFGCIAISLVLYAITWRQMRAVEKTIADIDDVAMIGPLAEAWDAERFLKPKSVIATLCRLLPRLQASDANLLTRHQRACLYNAIHWKAGRAVYQYDRKLTVAILKALEQIGDKEALPFVRRAAHSRHKDVREAANACLGFLIEQAEQHKRGAQLLRPADARTSAPDVLLRPSTGLTTKQQTPPEQLLRAHNEE